MNGFFNMTFIMLPMILFGIFSFIFWLAMLIDCALNETDSNERLLWIIIIIFTNFIGAVIYFFIRRANRTKRVL
jgi:hypothetical protein